MKHHKYITAFNMDVFVFNQSMSSFVYFPSFAVCLCIFPYFLNIYIFYFQYNLITQICETIRERRILENKTNCVNKTKKKNASGRILRMKSESRRGATRR